MASKITKKGAAVDIAFLASMIGFVAVMINQRAFTPGVHSVLLIALVAVALALNISREARKEKQLDELELASASFGARWAVTVLGIVMMLLLFVTPMQSAVAHLANAVENGSGVAMVRPSKTFLMGLCTAMVIQLGAKSALASIWKWTKR
ncbi:hypothetical protein GCM10009127_17760 [Alteraurantiacibacter aestuarii]|uniref:Uncharacterized protein n=1 Tax=Alteraurantiacibacter aestuarii TaxID=650004 RepID=A0A844ZPT0_9SPHN|nr:hypothetical protein [Alteraurantiacibacter aestuarii]MXO87639.1 hypothetical protein [Alteraurantiacibacter aestuarii]